MQFSFEVNPNLDVALGIEVDMQEEFVDEEFDAPILGPTGAKPGSEDKVQMLTARYAAGMPLWHEEDCYDHGPGALIAGEGDEFSGFNFVEQL